MDDERRVCANCRVLVEPHAGGWRHPPELVEKFSRSVCADPAPGRAPSGSEARFGLGRVKASGRDKLTLRGSLDELTPPPGVPVTVAVDGSYKLTVTERVSKPMSYGWLSTGGPYGLGTAIVPGKVVGGDRALQAELRAIAAALAAVDDGRRITVLSDSRSALDFMILWKLGHDVMPGGYHLERAGGRESTLARLARRARDAGPRIETCWVRGHNGHPLNEGADALAKTARAWYAGLLERDTVEADARRIAASALARHAGSVAA